jgi:NADPH:quinone reductase-like Zn-dependent oxidoreductase
MKAVVLTGYGDVDKLEWRDVPDVKAGAGEVKIRTEATSVNPVDWKMRQGYANVPLPNVLGRDVAGTAVEVGPGVTRIKVGDRVMGFVPHAYAEFVIAKEDQLAKIPTELSTAEAAALPLVTTTGAQLIEEHTRPKKGDTVLVTGAVGGVGRTAVYAAKKLGAKVLAGVRKSQKKEAEDLGADGIVAIDDDAEIAKLPELDAIADTVSGETLHKLLPHLKKGGTLGSVLGGSEEAKQRGIEVHAFTAHPDGRRLSELAEAATRGELQIPIGKKLPLSQARDAHRLAEKGGAGKIVMTA